MTAPGPDLVSVRRWLGVAVGSVIVAGIFALLLVLGRTPPFSLLFDDAHFFKRCLVVHVVLGLVIWSYAFIAALFHLLPGAGHCAAGRAGGAVATVGMGLMMLAAAQPGAEPVLANYVPVIDHPLFLGGLALFALGVAAAFFQERLVPGPELAAADGGVLPAAAQLFLRAAALAFVVALATFWGAWLGTPRQLPAESYYEFLMWGGGHVLQFANVAAMLAVWLTLLRPVVGGRSILSRRAAGALCALLLLPILAAPLFGAFGTTTGFYRASFTRIMEFGIFPVVTVVLAACVWAVVRGRRGGTLVGAPWRDWRFLSFVVSAALTVTGFLLGAAIHGSNTMVPAHYHAAIGAVTAAFMAMTYVLLEAVGMPLRGVRLRRLAACQVPLFGFGQLVFAIGFALAGMSGSARKAYAGEQQVRTLAEHVGLGVMGAGGIVAALGGLLFLGLILVAGARRRESWPAAVVAAAAKQGGNYGK